MKNYTDPRKPYHSLISLPDILDRLVVLEDEDKVLAESLHVLIENEGRVQESLKKLKSMSPGVGNLRRSADALSARLGGTARTADNVAGHVRMLDEEIKRVKEASAYVAQVMELKASLNDLRIAIDEQDWETAARLCARTASLPGDMASGRFAMKVVPTAESPSPPTQILQDYRMQLRGIFLEHFVSATQSRDSALTTRFFKLFPPIGCEKEGIDAYADFVLELVQTKIPSTAKSSSPLYYITALTSLFESVCNILDQHLFVVEKYYGHGKMASVTNKLLEECDNSVKRLLDGWEEDRAVERKLIETGSSRLSLKSSGSISKQLILFPIDYNKDVDPRDIDKILNEIAAMVMRFSAFRRFLCTSDSNATSSSSTSVSLAGVTEPSQQSGHPIDSSACTLLFEELIMKYYVPFDTWYIRATLNQAFKNMLIDWHQSPPSTNIPDLIFYIIRTLLTRTVNMGSVMAVKCTTLALRIILEEEYVAIIKSRLDDVFRNGVSTGGSSRIDKTEKEMRSYFIVLLNDLDISCSHMERVVKDVLSSQALVQNYLLFEWDTVQILLNNMLNVNLSLRSTVKNGLDQLFNQLLRPRLRTIITDTYRNISYDLDEDGYISAEQQDLVRKRFVKSWDDLLEGFKDSLTPSNYRTLLGQTVDVLLRPWEKFILTLKYTELGAIRFDQDIRSLSAYFTLQLSYSDIREKLQRLQQISTLLNIDKDENVEEFYRSSGISWRLTIAEALNITSLKT